MWTWWKSCQSFRLGYKVVKNVNLVKILSIGVSSISAAGTRHPIWARTQSRAVWRIKVDLPPKKSYIIKFWIIVWNWQSERIRKNCIFLTSKKLICRSSINRNWQIGFVLGKLADTWMDTLITDNYSTNVANIFERMENVEFKHHL